MTAQPKSVPAPLALELTRRQRARKRDTERQPEQQPDHEQIDARQLAHAVTSSGRPTLQPSPGE